MPDLLPVKDSAKKVAAYLNRRWPNFVSVPELIASTGSDARKRVSELIRAGYPIEKERNGHFVNYRYMEEA